MLEQRACARTVALFGVDVREQRNRVECVRVLRGHFGQKVSGFRVLAGFERESTGEQ